MGGFRLFTLANVPVSVSPWFLFLLYYLSKGRGLPLALAAIGITLSLLVHEFGHALMARRFGMAPEILLHGYGGHTSHSPAQRDRDDALIVAAGPAAGLLLAAISYLVFTFVPLAELIPQQAFTMGQFLSFLLGVNIFWSLFNLLPLWPMDGGLLFRLGMLRLFKPARAERVTHIMGLLLVAVGVALATRYSPHLFTYLILGMMGWQNFQALSSGSNGQPVRRENPRAKELLGQAERAYEAGEDDLAARLCHQLRAESNLPPNVLARAWTILGVTTTRKGEYEEALSYLKRAPDSPEVIEASAQCLYQLDMRDELEGLTRSKGFAQLPKDTQQQIRTALQEEG
jgi:stage IV sporulation protein FB